jgi:PAS domain S-box-containing protein
LPEDVGVHLDPAFAGADEILCVLDDARAVVAVSAGFTAALGWTGDDLRGRALTELLYPECRPFMVEAFDATAGWVPTGGVEVQVQARDGTWRWLGWSFVRVPGQPGVRARAASLSRERERQILLSRFSELSLEILGIWRGGLSYDEVNPAFCHTLDWTEDELKQKSFTELIHPDDYERTADMGRRLLAGATAAEIENRYLTRSGDYRWISWSIARDPQTGAILAVGRDVTRVREMFEELRDAKELAEQAMSTAETAGRARNTFLSNMSHELRTPLNGILGYAQLLGLDPDLSDKQREGVEAIRRSGEHLLVLINDMLDLAKMEAGTLQNTPSELHLGEFLAGIAGMFETRARSKRIGFGYDVLNELPQVVLCDETRLRQVLVNLLSHAIRGREHGGVFMGAGFAGGVLRLRIEEAPSGLSSARAETFFEPLDRFTPRSLPVTGTVLDLPARLLHSMSGTLVVERRDDNASVFWVEIRPEVVHGWTQRLPAVRVIEGYEGARKTVLVADDKIENRGLLTHMLEPLGFDIVHATDGEEALRLAREAGPDIILMDLVMPVLDGFEATRRLRARDDGRQIPIIAMSASSFEPDQNRSREVGCDGFLAKPVRRDKLLALLEQHLGITWRYRTPAQQAPAGPASAAGAAGAAGAARTRPAAASASAAASAPAALSPAQLRAIYDAASIGDIRAILTIVGSVRKIEGSQASAGPAGLVEEIHRLAKRFQARKIKERIEPLLEQS